MADNLSDEMKIVTVPDKEAGLSLAKQMLLSSTNSKSILFASGGFTPKNLYTQIARERKLKVGACALVDERYGESFHSASNESMIQQTGLLSYFKTSSTPFYGIIQKGFGLEDVSSSYAKTFGTLHSRYSNRVAILGIGLDGHTAGIPAGEKVFSRINMQGKTNYMDTFYGEKEVVGFEDPVSMEEGGYGSRVTLTFTALSRMDRLFIVVFGEEKKEILKKVFEKGSIEEIPSRFYLQSEIAKKTLLITDQKI